MCPSCPRCPSDLYPDVIRETEIQDGVKVPGHLGHLAARGESRFFRAKRCAMAYSPVGSSTRAVTPASDETAYGASAGSPRAFESALVVSGEDRAEPALAARAGCLREISCRISSPRLKPPYVDQQSLQNVRVAAEVHAAHTAGLIENARRAAPSARREAAAGAGPAGCECVVDCDKPRRVRPGSFFQLRRPRSGSEM